MSDILEDIVLIYPQFAVKLLVHAASTRLGDESGGHHLAQYLPGGLMSLWCRTLAALAVYLPTRLDRSRS